MEWSDLGFFPSTNRISGKWHSVTFVGGSGKAVWLPSSSLETTTLGPSLLRFSIYKGSLWAGRSPGRQQEHYFSQLLNLLGPQVVCEGVTEPPDDSRARLCKSLEVGQFRQAITVLPGERSAMAKPRQHMPAAFCSHSWYTLFTSIITRWLFILSTLLSIVLQSNSPTWERISTAPCALLGDKAQLYWLKLTNGEVLFLEEKNSFSWLCFW